MKTTSKNKPTLMLSVVLLVAGFGLLAGMIAIAVTLGRAEIHLQRDAGAVTGSIRWTLAGVPVYSRSLDGLAKVERDDYETRDSHGGTSGRTGTQPLKRVGRIRFVDAEGAELAWAERVEVLNEQERIERFLASDLAGAGVNDYAFQERAGTLRERIKAFMFGMVTIPMLGIGGVLCVLAGVLSLSFRAKSWSVARPVPIRRTQRFEHRVTSGFSLPGGARESGGKGARPEGHAKGAGKCVTPGGWFAGVEAWREPFSGCTGEAPRRRSLPRRS